MKGAGGLIENSQIANSRLKKQQKVHGVQRKNASHFGRATRVVEWRSGFLTATPMTSLMDCELIRGANRKILGAYPEACGDGMLSLISFIRTGFARYWECIESDIC